MNNSEHPQALVCPQGTGGRPFLWTRRRFARVLAAAVPIVGLFPAARGVESGAARKPDSKVAGVQIGLNVPYSFGEGRMSGDEVLRRCVELGLSAVELRAQPVESFLGAPAELIYPPKKGEGAGEGGKAAAQRLAEWRKSAPRERVQEFRKRYEDAGVAIEIVKIDGIFNLTDEELDYVFALAKGLGGRAISSEISTKEAELKRVGSFADRHELRVGYHGHASTRPEDWERAFSCAKYNGANVDLGHFVAGNNVSPAAFLTRYHERITHVHVKDRKRNNGPNAPFGEGDTPIIEALRLIRDNQWDIQATIEFEYKVPDGSDRMTEIARSVKYCRDALR